MIQKIPRLPRLLLRQRMSRLLRLLQLRLRGDCGRHPPTAEWPCAPRAPPRTPPIGALVVDAFFFFFFIFPRFFLAQQTQLPAGNDHPCLGGRLGCLLGRRPSDPCRPRAGFVCLATRRVSTRRDFCSICVLGLGSSCALMASSQKYIRWAEPLRLTRAAWAATDL